MAFFHQKPFANHKIRCYIKELRRRDGRVDEGATLEMWCGATHRGFESLSLRHFYAQIPGIFPVSSPLSW